LIRRLNVCRHPQSYAILTAMTKPHAALSHLFLHVADLEPIRRFYVDGLGLDLADDGSGYVRLGTTTDFHIGLEVVPGLAQPDEMELVICVPDVDTTYQALTAQGVQFDAPPADMPWGNRQAWTRDPFGTRVSIYSVAPRR
jgi:catechol 2,3-dioxygenase-like lactoylglutathione lyase family enzyme